MIYLRVIDEAENINVSLVVAKTSVAQIRQLSIPHLELSGATLLAKLLNETAEVLAIPKDKLRAWTDFPR